VNSSAVAVVRRPDITDQLAVAAALTRQASRLLSTMDGADESANSVRACARRSDKAAEQTLVAALRWPALGLTATAGALTAAAVGVGLRWPLTLALAAATGVFLAVLAAGQWLRTRPRRSAAGRVAAARIRLLPLTGQPSPASDRHEQIYLACSQVSSAVTWLREALATLTAPAPTGGHGGRLRSAAGEVTQVLTLLDQEGARLDQQRARTRVA
jgi:hypothetical protein